MVAANDGRALLVPQGSDGYGDYITFRPGRHFRFVEAPLPRDFEAGAWRADARLQRLLASDDLRDLNGGYMHVFRTECGQILA